MNLLYDHGRVAVIINTGSRAGQDLDADAIERAFAAHGRDARVMRVQGGQIRETALAALEEGTRIIVAAGGDGTVNALAEALIDRDDVALGVLPVGTLNHFARDLGMPEEIEDAVAVIAKGATRTVDVGEVNGRVFLNNSSLGLYAQLVVKREQLQRDTPLGKWTAMASAAWSVLRHPRTFSICLHADGDTLRQNTPFVFVGNNDYQLEGLKPGTRNCLDAGELVIYVLRHKTPWGFLMLALRALTGRIVEGRDLNQLRASSLVVESHHAQAQVARDGEVGVMETPLRYRILSCALRVVAPIESECA